jgi:hypothetical protein
MINLILIIVLSILAGVLNYLYLKQKKEYEDLKVRHEELETACKYLIKCWDESKFKNN